MKQMDYDVNEDHSSHHHHSKTDEEEIEDDEDEEDEDKQECDNTYKLIFSEKSTIQQQEIIDKLQIKLQNLATKLE